MAYGIPYQGSKNRIAKDIIGQLPSGHRFVDLFAGGCAMTHCAMLSGKYDRFLCNDLYPDGTNLFRQALEGEVNKPEYFRWVSREEFFAKKDTDSFVKWVWSFGNDGATYMYGKQIEPLKKGFHYAIVYDDWTYLEQYAHEHNWKDDLLDSLKNSLAGVKTINERRLKLLKRAYDNDIKGWHGGLVQSLTYMNRLQNIEHMNRLENIEHMNRLENIDFTSIDYREYQYEKGDVVYCDPPYSLVKRYCGREFDKGVFWNWVRTRDYPVYVSEYSAPEDFISIWQKGIPKLMSGGKSASQQAIEKLFIHSKWLNVA